MPMPQTNHIEAIGATATSGAAAAASIMSQAHDWAVTVAAFASLAWWMRIWIRDLNAKPPVIK